MARSLVIYHVIGFPISSPINVPGSRRKFPRSGPADRSWTEFGHRSRHIFATLNDMAEQPPPAPFAPPGTELSAYAPPAPPGRLRNLTPHDPLLLIGTDGQQLALPAEQPPARLAERHVPEASLLADGVRVPVVRIEYHDPVDLPNPETGTLLVVSQLVARALPERHDLRVPAALLRDHTGAVTGCRALARFDHGPTDEEG